MNRCVFVFLGILLLSLAFTPFTIQAQRVDTTDTARLGTKDSLRMPVQPVALKFTARQLRVPVGLMAVGIGATLWNNEESLKNELVEERNEHLFNFDSHLDNYLQYSPIVIAYGLDAFGIPAKTDFMNRSAIMFKGELLALGSVTLLKHITHERRPNGSDYYSFPSGHTTEAFAAATLLSEEYKDRFKWMPYAAYGIATSVGVFRMANNKHYIGDVIMGAGLGILSMKIAYWTHQYKWGKKAKIRRDWLPSDLQ
ncbi:MAG TPA: phosphatase PAP2 family protein [Arachidicoccus sp.]|nr:phosphatase PAP2 family protein [Arachidicoccus sp.]